MITPLPWHTNGGQIIGPAGKRQILADMSRDVGILTARENAELICRAVNAHDELVKLLEDGILQLGRLDGEALHHYARSFSKVAANVAKAKGVK